MNWINSNSSKNGIVINSKISRARNIRGYLFPHKISEERGKKLINEIEAKIICNEEAKKNFKCIRLWEITKDECINEIEKQIINGKIVKFINKAAYILNKDKTIAIMINEEEHIKIQYLSNSLDLEEGLLASDKIDDLISDDMGYSFSEEFGYTSSSPMNTGNGFKASIMMHLQELMSNNKIDLLRMELAQIGLLMREIYMKSDGSSSGFYILSNQMSGEISEKDICNKIKNVAINIAYLENNLRKQRYEHYKYEVEDLVLRSLGAVKSCRMISYDEALTHISNIRLGIQLEIITGIKYSKLNYIMVNLSDYSVSRRFKNIKTSRQYLYKRAEFIRKIIND